MGFFGVLSASDGFWFRYGQDYTYQRAPGEDFGHGVFEIWHIVSIIYVVLFVLYVVEVGMRNRICSVGCGAAGSNYSLHPITMQFSALIPHQI